MLFILKEYEFAKNYSDCFAEPRNDVWASIMAYRAVIRHCEERSNLSNYSY
jgi:hypothetical protein